MPVIDCIKCEAKKKTEIYVFLFSMFSKSLFSGNQSVFQNLNIVQIDIDKKDTQ